MFKVILGYDVNQVKATLLSIGMEKAAGVITQLYYSYFKSER
ncbi:hypothetical protein CUMW_113080 [Citrus unshiu]|uniref:Uncharacterized protein n=1 Tax=Citrus unshiu TaxID=55188 RepID=A0A2H5P8E2_CITUN|nr:hypothetical protein CUMW_113080 [Citrus unshiu]